MTDNQPQSPPSLFTLGPEGTLNFGFVEFDTTTQQAQAQPVQRTITITAGEGGCSIVEAEFGTRSAALPYRFSTRSITAEDSLTIPPHGDVSLVVNFAPPKHMGVFTDVLTLTAKITPDEAEGADVQTAVCSESLQMVAVVHVSEDMRQFAAREPFVGKKALRDYRNAPQPIKIITAPIDADSTYQRRNPFIESLKLHKCPQWLRDIVIRLSNPNELVARIKGYLPEKSYERYADFWTILLHAERVQEEIAMHMYDMQGVEFNKEGKLYFFAVHNLAERRPSVLRDDRIKVYQPGAQEGYEGIVCEVRLNDVGVRFAKKFKPTPAARYTVEFLASDVQHRRRPPTDEMVRQHQLDIRQRVAENSAQKQAVLSIYFRSHGSAPFVIFGPPGTGKTVTLIEAARQLLKHRPETRLLLTAPSNAAADLLCTRIADGIDPSCILRLNARRREPASVPQEILAFSHRDEEGRGFDYPELDKLKKFRVVVATCSTADLRAIGVEPGHFSHIFIDEAGQAMEPEAFLPITLANDSTSVILAGDPKQLGPVVRCPSSTALGLGTSFLENIMSHPDYLEGNKAKRGVTYSKLINNYRNHPDILQVPNRLFYAKELSAQAPRSVTDRLASWNAWPNRKFPVLFHAIRGKEGQEGRSPSFFNYFEITQVKDYVSKLLDSANGADLAPTDIGIIAPYAAQAKKLRQALGQPKLTVGSVEQFQGSERGVIIISTVRSNPDHLEHDKRFALGFLSNPKRFNVSVTRAQAGLIVVGDPFLLALDPMWYEFLLYVKENKGWRGEAWP